MRLFLSLTMERPITAINPFHSKAGFTLIESLLVIALMGVMASLVAPIYLKTWEISKITSDPLPLSKTMLALSEMDVWSRGAEEVKFVSFPTAGTPVFQSSASSAQGLAFKVPVIHLTKSGDTWVQHKTTRWNAVHFTEDGITKYVWNTDGTGLTKTYYYSALIKLDSQINSAVNWRNTGIQTIHQEITLKLGEFKYALPFNTPQELLR